MVAVSRRAPNVWGGDLWAFGGDLVVGEGIEVCPAAAVQDDAQLGPFAGARIRTPIESGPVTRARPVSSGCGQGAASSRQVIGCRRTTSCAGRRTT